VCPTFVVKGTKSRGRVRQPISDPHTLFILSDPSNFDYKWLRNFRLYNIKYTYGEVAFKILSNLLQTYYIKINWALFLTSRLVCILNYQSMFAGVKVWLVIWWFAIFIRAPVQSTLSRGWTGKEYLHWIIRHLWRSNELYGCYIIIK